MKKMAVVMVVHDQATEIEQNLQRFLTMPCETDYEVIVVDDSSTDETPQLLKQLKSEYPRLYTTFLPKSVVFNPSRLQLALNLGVKAATKQELSQTENSWIVLADINRPPASEDWLQKLADAIDDRHEVLMVYSGRKKVDNMRCQAWETLEEAVPLIRKAERRSGRGHRGKWQKNRRGVYDAIVVCRERALDVIRLFDQTVRAKTLWDLRLRVYWKNLHQE